MKTIKPLFLVLLLAVPYACAMEQLTINAIEKDIQDIEDSPNPRDTARAKILIAYQHGISQYYLHTAIATKKLKAAQGIIDAQSLEKADKADKNNKYPLDYALAGNFTDGIKLLLKHKISNLNPYYETVTSCPIDALECFCQEEKKAKVIIPSSLAMIISAVINTQNKERIQILIDNELVHVPKPLGGGMADPDNPNSGDLNERDGFYYAAHLTKLIALSSQSTISLPDRLCQQAKRYIISVYAYNSIYDYSHSSRARSYLKDALDKYQMPIENKNIMFGLYTRLLSKMSDADLLDTLKKSNPIDPTTEWEDAVAILDTIKSETDRRRFIDRAHTLFSLYPDMIIDQTTANKIHDGLNGSSGCEEVTVIRDRIYDLISADRVPLRQYDLFYWYRQYTKAQPDDDDDGKKNK